MDADYLPNSTLLGVPLYGEAAQAEAQISQPISAAARKPILTVGELGQTVGEGRGSGSFIESLQAAIRKGASTMELSMSSSGSEPNVGPDLYGREKRREIREIARANQIQISSVHTPVQVVANMSGFAGEQRGFMDEHRHIQVNEVKKAAAFAADTTNGAAIIVHTGEFQRPFTEQSWSRNKYGEFRHYDEEPHRFTAHLVDDRTGKVIGEAKKTQVVYEPDYKTAESEGIVGQRDANGRVLKPYDWVDIHGNWIDPDDNNRMFERIPYWDSEFTRFKTKRLTFEDFRDRANRYNERYKDEIARGTKEVMAPEEMFVRTQMQNNALRSRGGSLFHGRYYDREKRGYDEAVKALKYIEKIEANTPKEEQWRLVKEMAKVPYASGAVQQFIGTEHKMPSQVLREYIKAQKDAMQYSHEASASADAEADRIINDMQHVISVDKYAKRKTSESYAEAAMHAMDLTRDRHLDKPIFLAPENIFPEMGYGSHPEELTELVQLARKKMVQFLTQKEIEIQGQMRHNPHYRGWSQDRAKKAANAHIRATLDTEHMGMWKKHFLRKAGEREQDFNKRFNAWYMDQVQKMHKAGVIGHLHIADGFGFGHGNLPVGQGDTPVVSAVKYLKEHGYKGAFLSEGYGDAPRMMRDAWKAFGSPIYGVGGPMRSGSPTRWNDVMFSYFGKTEPPHYVFGSYAPSNDWTLWSQVPME